MYKIFRKRNGKTFGPYYYKTIRTGCGKTETIYLGKTKKEALVNEAGLKKTKSRWRIPKLKGFLAPIIIAIALSSLLLIPQLITGFMTFNTQASYTPLQIMGGALSIIFQPEEFCSQYTVVP